MQETELPIKNTEVDLKNYDTFIVGAPIWGGKPAPLIKTFVNSAKNIKGKKAAVFVTSGGAATNRTNAKDIMKNWMEPAGIQVSDVFFGLQMSKGKIKSGEEQIESFVQSVLSL